MKRWTGHLNITEKKDKKAFWGKMLTAFFILMVICTIISRAADSVIVPKANVDKPSSGTLKYTMEGTGSIKASEGTLVTVPGNLRVKAITPAGTNIEEGGELAVIDMNELALELDKQNAELEKLRLQLQNEQINGTPDAVTPQTFSAGKALEQADISYNEAAAKLEQAIQLEKQESAERAVRAEKKKKQAYDTYMNEGGAGSSEAKARYDQELNRIDEEMTQEEAGAKAQIENLRDKKEGLEDALEQARVSYDVAAAEDANAEKNSQKAKESSAKIQEGLAIDVEQQQKIVDKLNEIMNMQGIIKSPVKGSITQNGLSEGLVTTGQEYIRIGTGGYRFEAAVDKDDAEKLKTGDVMQVEFPDKKEAVKLKISNIQLQGPDGSVNSPDSGQQGGGDAGQGSSGDVKSQGKMAQIIAEMEGNDYVEGIQGKYKIQKDSDIRYNWIVPVEAIRQDQKGMYCLAVRKKNTILGEEYVAERINLTQKAKDFSKIAVEGALTEESRLIVGSSRQIDEGDRFRIESKN